jgi:hypothetical protein
VIPPPSPATLWICQQVIVERITNNPSLIGIHTGLRVDGFPSPPQRLSVFASLTDTMGRGRLRLTIDDPATDSEVFSEERTVAFADHHAVVNVHFRIATLRFPSPGRFGFFLFVDDDLVAQRFLRVYEAQA